MSKVGGCRSVAMSQDPVTLMNTYRSYVSMLDSNAKDENKLKAVQELSTELETIVGNPQYPSFLDHALKIFLKILHDGEPHFISEHSTQAIRKLILEIIHRIPTNDHLKPHVKTILSLMFHLLEVENEENVLVCLRIIIELHKTFRPTFSPEIQHFLGFVKNIYKELPSHLNKIFQPRPPLKIKDLTVNNLEVILSETFTTTSIQLEKENPDGSTVQYNLLPRAVLSLKVLAELPIIVVLMYQLYKQSVHQDVAEFIPLIMVTITLKPSVQHRTSEGFNREVFVDFMAAQIKTLSFLAYIVRIYQEVVNTHSAELAEGMLGLLRLCPQEVAHLRKELLIAARHILATELREKFVGCLEELFDENILIGSGWTAYESLRPLAYSTLADLVHHVRHQLPLKDLAKAVTVFSKNVHDESLLTTIQTMSCKLLLNLVDCIRSRSDRENGNGREILMRMLEVLVLKFKTIAKLQLPVLNQKCQQQQQIQLQNVALAQSMAAAASAMQQGTSSNVPTPHPTTSTATVPASVGQGAMAEVKTEHKEETKAATFPVGGLLDGREDKPKFGFPASQAANYTVADCRALVKTLVCGVKTITWGIAALKGPADPARPAAPTGQTAKTGREQLVAQSKPLQPKETLVFIRLIKYAFQALDVYTLPAPVPGQAHARTHSVQTVRPKEEKEVLEHLAGVFTMMNPLTFREVFSTSIDYMVDRIYKNYALQIVANSFLANRVTSPIFATILIEYLLKRMEEMGSNMDRSNLYLKLFKLVFGSVSLFPAENEQMLKPHLHQIVNRSMDLALSAKEPYNYFLLLRALFRSIGGGSHDLLYQEFLPLLPNLLHGLNLLQSGLHKQHMKDLFVELCLTVPVRLSSLLPYLPMLMDPLVSALNGSQTLVSQGLRTLELCVDNLQPDFLYDHIQPVRADLMQALWRTLRNPNDNIAQVAFRVLGKFGGGNRKMMVEPQKLEYNTSENAGPCITVDFPEHKNNISLPIEKIIETAFNALKSTTTDAFYRKQCWEVIKGFLAANIEQDAEPQGMQQFFAHPNSGEIKPIQPPLYKCPDAQARKVHEMALTGMYVAAAIKELRPSVLSFMANLVRHYTAVMVAQQCGIFAGNGRHMKFQGMDPLVLIDATAAIMGHEEKELCKPGSLGLILIIDTAAAFLSSKTRASQLPFYEYLAEKMCSLCYERAWYAKLGGCIAIKSLIERIPPKWVYAHMYTFMKALLFVMMDLTGEVSSGAVDMAKSNLERMLSGYGTPIVPNNENDDLIEAQEKAINEVVQELIRHLTLANACAREQAMHSLRILAQVSNKTVTAIIEPHRDLLADMIPPRKPFLRHQPINAQIGMLDGNTFCITLQPRLFVIDLEQPDHKLFFAELISLCDHEDVTLQKLPCYKAVTDFVPLRKAALRVLAALHYLEDKRKDIFTFLYKALNSSHSELQEAGFECMKQMIANCELDIEMVHTSMRPLLSKLGEYPNLSLQILQQLSYLTQLFPNSFNEKLCEQLLQHLEYWLGVVAAVQSNERKVAVNEMKMCSAIINIFHQIPAATSKLIEPLLTLVLKTEKILCMEAGSPFREPVVKFLQLYPVHTMELLLKESKIRDEQASRFLEYLLKEDKGRPFRDVLQKSPSRLVTMALGLNQGSEPSTSSGTISALTLASAVQKKQYLTIRAVSLLVKYDDHWLSSQHQLVACLRKIWISLEFQERHLRTESVDFTQWKEPKLLAKCLLNFVKHHPNEIELLFQLLRAFTGRFIPDFEFLRDFLENTVANKYTVGWKRMAFFKFVELFHNNSFPQDLKAKILQYILIPSFAQAFEKGEGEQLIGGPPAPEQDLTENVMSVFIGKVIDPEKPFGTSDAVRILLLQFSCLLVEQASPHIHDAANKKQGNKLRRLMTFAWPCLLVKNCVDPATKYHGHLLLANIIAKFAIHKRIVLQVFHSLLKAHAAEARTVVRQALEILTPAMPVRMEDGNSMLTHWTKKIIVEEGHTLAQLVHLLQLLVRHYKVYYPVRHHLIHHMVSSVQRLVFTPNATLEHKKLAVDLAEVIIRWELQRHKEEQERNTSAAAAGDKSDANMEIAKRAIDRHQFTWAGTDLHSQNPDPGQGTSTMAGRRVSVAEAQDLKRVKGFVGAAVKIGPDRYKPVDKNHADAIVNFLLRMACQVNETATATAGSSGELLSRRCVALLKTGLKADVWPNAELKLAWFDKLLTTVEGHAPQPNYNNICTALDLLAFLLTILRKETILATFRPLQRGIATCLTCSNTKVIRSVHNLLSRLMNIFPTEPTNSNVASKYEELECLYAAVHTVVYEGLQSYEKATTNPPSALFGTLMILKAACVNNPCYIDRLIAFFMRSLQKMAREHLSPSAPDTNPMNTDLLILSLDLVKNRVGVMGQDMRKTFIGTILVGLIEKSPSVNVLKAITKMVEDWVKCKTPIALNQSPSIREKSILQVKMMQFIEKRFPNELELNAQFLELVHYVYKDDSLKGTELQSKLEPAFMAGLRCVQPHIRAKFFDVFDSSIRRRLHERLMYIVCSQNWDTIGMHFWIKQCIELLLVTAVNESTIQSATPDVLLPSVTSVLNLADSQDRVNFAISASIKEEPMDEENREDDEIDIELSNDDGHTRTDSNMSSSQARQSSEQLRNNLPAIISKQVKFLESLKEVKTISFLTATAQLCHMDTSLAQHLWVQLFPRLWKILSEKHQNVLAAEIIPFLCSGSHVIQKDSHPSAAGVFAEGVSHCQPPIPIKPVLLKYLGKSHNIWHRSSLLLEQLSFDKNLNAQGKSRAIPMDTVDPDLGVSPQHEALDMISELYTLLKEDDLWSSIWQKRAKFHETVLGVSYEQHGIFDLARAAYERSMEKYRSEIIMAAPISMQSECILLPEHWVRCTRELNDWEQVLEYASTKEAFNPYLVLENSWKQQDWAKMKESLDMIEQNCPKELAWKVNLYKGYLSICNPDDRHLNMVERLVEIASTLCIREWRRLPHIVSHIHLPILQAAQQIMELQDAAQLHQGLMPTNVGRQSSLHDMKAIMKTWRNRLPVLSDDLSHWSEIFAWRQEHYQTIVSSYDPNSAAQMDGGSQGNQAMFGYHASAQSLIHFGKIARKQGLPYVCLEALGKIHTIPSVPIVDCFQKIRQQLKCSLQVAHNVMKTDQQEAIRALNHGLDVIDSTNLQYFSKEMTAEFFAIKGLFLTQLGQFEEANKAFSAAAQTHDVLVKAWALWGDYLEQIFTKDKFENRNIEHGIFALVCYLNSCRHQNESKSRKYIAKAIWLLTYDDESLKLMETFDKYSVGVPPIQWVPWVPQLLTCLVRNEGRLLLNVLSQVGRVFPQAVYFPIRTLYLILKIEQRERNKSEQGAAAFDSRLGQSPHLTGVSSSTASTSSTIVPPLGETSQSTGASPAGSVPLTEPGNIKATPAMWRCSRIMHVQHELHPTVLASLEGIVDQMVWFRENVYEEVLRQLRQALAKCYAVAYENAAAVSEASVTPHTLNFVKKLVSTFGIGVENVSSMQQTFATTASESLAKRAQATKQDPVFQKMKGQFTADFDFTAPGAMKLHNLISKLKKWIKILEAKTKLLPKSFLIEQKCRFLSFFTQNTADIELPGEFLLPRHNHFFVRIARFMPRVDIVHKHNTAARRLYIKGHNGKIYPYLVINDACLSDARREERVLQLMRMLNTYLGKQKETSRRFLNFTVPRVVSLSPQMRLVEDNVSSLSLLDVYKQCCEERSVEHDAPLHRFYERLATVQARGSQASHQVLRDILKDVQNIIVSRESLKKWAERTYPSATDYWTFRKQFTLQLSLVGFVEYVLHLTRLNPDMMYIHQDSGLMNVSYFRFNVDDVTGDLDANRPVPFRLTPNIAEFITSVGICGPMTASMIETARCLVQPNFKVQALLKAILRDEMIAWHKKRQDDTQPNSPPQDMEGGLIVQMVARAVTAISARMQSLAVFEGSESKVATLVAAANSHDNLCRMDPAWHPWL